MSASPQQIRSPRLADQVAAALLDRIRHDRLTPGQQLPSEREIGEQYGVSRTVVREATRFLLARGVVEVGAGRGLVVAAVGPEVASENLTLFLQNRVDGDYRAVHEIREVLEVEVARRAAQRATDDEIDALRTAHDAMAALSDAAADLQELSLADVEFHRRLAHATGNDIFVMLLDALAPALVSGRRANLVRGDSRDEALVAHATILERVAAHDADGAAAAMRDHLDFVIALWSRLDAERGGTDGGGAGATGDRV